MLTGEMEKWEKEGERRKETREGGCMGTVEGGRRNNGEGGNREAIEKRRGMQSGEGDIREKEEEGRSKTRKEG
jgi:hypothetical protein